MTSTTVKRSVLPGKRAPTSRQRHIKAERLDPEERAAGRKAARAKVPLEAHADFQPAKSRDPVALLLIRLKPASLSWCRFDMAGCWCHRSASTEGRH